MKLFRKLFCKHKWEFVRTEKGDFRTVDVCVCIHCGERRGFVVW